MYTQMHGFGSPIEANNAKGVSGTLSNSGATQGRKGPSKIVRLKNSPPIKLLEADKMITKQYFSPNHNSN